MQFEVRRDPPSHLGPDPSTLLKRVKRGPAERNITIWPCLPHQVWAALKCVADLYSVNEGWRFGTGAKVFLYIYRIHPNPSIFNIYFKTWLWSLSWWFILMMRRIIINIILITLTAMTIACHFITIIINYTIILTIIYHYYWLLLRSSLVISSPWPAPFPLLFIIILIIIAINSSYILWSFASSPSSCHNDSFVASPRASSPASQLDVLRPRSTCFSFAKDGDFDQNAGWFKHKKHRIKFYA